MTLFLLSMKIKYHKLLSPKWLDDLKRKKQFKTKFESMLFCDVVILSVFQILPFLHVILKKEI
jgi:hypothetical protein